MSISIFLHGKEQVWLYPYFLKIRKSFGVGDFGDLKRLVDWAVSTHQKEYRFAVRHNNDTRMD